MLKRLAILARIYSGNDQSNIKDADIHKTEKSYHFCRGNRPLSHFHVRKAEASIRSVKNNTLHGIVVIYLFKIQHTYFL